MRLATVKQGLGWAMMVGLMLASSGCQKLCQQASANGFKSLTDTDWRLVSSNDPAVKGSLSNFTFLIWHFDSTFGGTLNVVQNNQKDDVPVKTFTWNPNVTTKVVAIAFVGRATQDSQGKQQPGADEGTTYYQYTLSTSLTLYDTATGYNYYMVPFTGSVNPDSDCHF